MKIFFSIFLLLILFSCSKKAEKNPSNKNPDEITFISLSHIGGSSGRYSIVKITKNSLHAERGIIAGKVHKQKDSAINNKTWKQLISSIDVKTLDKIKSSSSIQSAGGIDETFIIKTTKKSYIYVNSYNDTLYYGQFQKLKDQLEKILPKEYQ